MFTFIKTVNILTEDLHILQVITFFTNTVMGHWLQNQPIHLQLEDGAPGPGWSMEKMFHETIA